MGGDLDSLDDSKELTVSWIVRFGDLIDNWALFAGPFSLDQVEKCLIERHPGC
jgi:hypothetical protein